MAILTQEDLKSINQLFAENFHRIWKDNLEQNMATKDDIAELKAEIATKPSTNHLAAKPV